MGVYKLYTPRHSAPIPAGLLIARLPFPIIAGNSAARRERLSRALTGSVGT